MLLKNMTYAGGENEKNYFGFSFTRVSPFIL